MLEGGAKKKAQAYELKVNESGAMVRVPVQTDLRTGQTTTVGKPRPAIVASAVSSAAPQLPPEEEDEVYGPNGEVLTGEARAKAIAEQLREAAETKEAEEQVTQVNDDENVYNDEGTLLTGEARRKFLVEIAAREKAEAEAEAKRKAEEEKKARKPGKMTKAAKNAMTITSGNDIEKMKLFYRFRARNPNFFIYTPEGNLQIKEGNAAKIPAMTIPLRAFSALRPEELEELEISQQEQQLAKEQEYVLKMRELHEAYNNYDATNPETIAKIVRLNNELREKSIARNSILYPEKWSKEIESIDTRDILLHMPYEERKLGYPVYLYKRYDLSRKDAVGHYRQHGEAKVQGMQGGATMVLFLTNPDDPQTGEFHPAAEREFVYNETRYVSPYQAYETERFKEFEDESMVSRLLGTRSAKTIRNLVSGEKRQPAFPIKLWEDILETFYTQFKDAADTLKATGSARFHMMDKLIGSPEYANALSNVRTKLKEHEDEAPGMIDTVKQSVISEEQQKKDKVGAIINNFRRG